MILSFVLEKFGVITGVEYIRISLTALCGLSLIGKRGRGTSFREDLGSTRPGCVNLEMKFPIDGSVG